MRSTIFFAAIAAVFLTGAAEAATFTFTFDNVTGSVAGTVAGEIDLPDGDGIFAATGLRLTAAPVQMGYSFPTDMFAVSNENGGSNLFTVAGGQIIDADFALRHHHSGSFILLALSYSAPYNITFLGTPTQSAGTLGLIDPDSSTLKFAPVPSVPLPAAALLLLGGLGALTGLRRRRT